MLRYAITDRSRVVEGEFSQEDALVQQTARLADSGVDYIQLREKDVAPCDLASLARKVLDVLRARPKAPRLLINSRADVAVAVGADGVHLTSASGSLTPADVRRLYASAGLPEPVVSVSCHALSEIPSARAAAANLILFGPVFEKAVASPPGHTRTDLVVAEGIGLNLLHLACVTAAPTPVLALGGLTEENTPSALSAGAAGIAAIRLFAA
jgi:thiamine-phosphate pyrophosphorylase